MNVSKHTHMLSLVALSSLTPPQLPTLLGFHAPSTLPLCSWYMCSKQQVGERFRAFLKGVHTQEQTAHWLDRPAHTYWVCHTPHTYAYSRQTFRERGLFTHSSCLSFGFSWKLPEKHGKVDSVSSEFWDMTTVEQLFLVDGACWCLPSLQKLFLNFTLSCEFCWTTFSWVETL